MRLVDAHDLCVYDFAMAKSTKRPVNLLVEERLLTEAKSSKINVSAVLDRALRAELARKWQEENAAAFEEDRKDIEANGLWSDGRRMW
jgi:antitoxin CcdA